MDKVTASVIVGLLVGICFIVLLALAFHPTILFPRQFPDEYEPAIAKSRESEAVKIFLQRNPFAYVQEVHEDVTGKLIVIRYGGVSNTWLNYEYPSVLVHQHSVDLTVYIDDKGDVVNLGIQCGTWYPEGPGGMSSVVDGKDYGNEFVLQLVKEGYCHS